MPLWGGQPQQKRPIGLERGATERGMMSANTGAVRYEEAA